MAQSSLIGLNNNAAHATPDLDKQHTHKVNILSGLCDNNIDFPLIAQWCAFDKPTEHNIAPVHLKQHRITNWPDMNERVDPKTRLVYQAVKATGLPNCMDARIPVDTGINVPAWRALMDGSEAERELVDFIEFGFPLGYHGPVVHTPDVTNHTSALQFPAQVEQFIAQELEQGALIGPYHSPLFKQWHHTSPIMTRPKSEIDKRRIITDLSYPKDKSVNAYIKKNCTMGNNHDHSLPTVKLVVDQIKRVGPGVTLFTIDVHRAYKNFRACPLDWPLLNVAWHHQGSQMSHYLDTSMPFGSKLSSLYFQRVANFVTRILGQEGIKGYMYLDDLIVIAPDPITAYHQFDRVRELFRYLGLPEAPGKTQPPSHKVTFLGIEIDTRSMTLSIPEKKVTQTLNELKKLTRRKTITRRQLQSVIGRIVHVAKCVAPARLFAARLLDALRGPHQLNYKVDHNIRADLAWFIQYLHQWNGVAYIPSAQVSATIYTDACMKGIGATDGKNAYAAKLAPQVTTDYHITEIEGFNVLLACDAFLGPTHRAKTILVRCDNKPAVQVFATGRGHNPVLLDTARKLWLLQAALHINIIFVHIPGSENENADILSRAFNGPLEYHRAKAIINDNAYNMCDPRMSVVNDISPV